MSRRTLTTMFCLLLMACGNLDQDMDGYTAAQGDCDDNDPTIHPNATEYCDGVDSDCSGTESSGIASFYYTNEDRWVDRTDIFTGTPTNVSTVNITDAGEYHLCDGTFYVSLQVLAEALIHGHYGTVILDGGNTHQVLNNDLGYNLTIENLIVANGAQLDGYGGGLYQVEGELKITNTAFTTNYAMEGGALSVWNTATTLENVTFSNNSAETGGAVGVYSGSYVSSNSRYTANTATLRGGALYGHEAHINETTVHYEGNNAGESGGAIYAFGALHQARNNPENTFSGENYCAFLNNYAPFGGVWFGSSSTLDMTSCDLMDEEHPQDNGVHDIFIEDNSFSYNYEKTTTVICDALRCGDSSEHLIESKTPKPYATKNYDIRTLIGNVYLSQSHDTLDAYSLLLKSQTACSPTFVIYEKAPDSEWALVLQQQSTQTTSPQFAHLGLNNIGIPLVHGNEYIFGVLDEEDCGLFSFMWGFDVKDADVGFGSAVGSIYEQNWSTTSEISYNKYSEVTQFTAMITRSH